MSNLDGNQEKLFGNNGNNNFYIDNERKIAVDESSSDRDTVYSWYDYEIGDNLENLTLLDSFYDKDGYLVPIELDNHIIYGHPNMFRLDHVQGNSNYLNKYNETVGMDCGIVAVKNLLIMAGKISEDLEIQLPPIFYQKETEINDAYYYYLGYDNDRIPVTNGFDITERDLLDYAINHNLASDIGTTNDLQRIALLAHFGIFAYNKLSTDSNFYEVIAENVKKGHGVIINTDAHSLAITGVVFNSNNNIEGFYLTDSSGEHANYEFCPMLYFNNLNVISANITIHKIIKDKEEIDTNGTGNELDNEITGNDGNNILKGESGVDTINGNKGDDIIIGDSTTLTNEELQELKNKNQEINIVNFETANDGNDYLDGGEGEDLLIGGGGNDILVGGKDEDSLYGGSGIDLLIAGETSKTQAELQNIINNNGSVSITDFESDNSQNTLYGGMGDDILVGDQGNDTMYGGGDDDIIYGGAGGDTIYGGKGDDVIVAGSSPLKAESIRSLAEKNSLVSDIFMSYEKFENKLYGGEDSDVIIGDSGNDIIHGDGGNDYLYGGDGNDYIYGGQDDDLLDGGKGNDKLYGGEGNDTYSFAENDGNDTIIDSDGQGKILADGVQLFGSSQDPISDNVWKDNDGNMYFWSGSDETNLLIQTACNNNITVENFKNGDLNINLKIPQNHPKTPKKHEKYFANAEQESNILQDQIIVDLNRDYNYETTDIQHGIYFDHENDGFACEYVEHAA